MDVCADVAAEQASNKMSERAIAIVLAPNLYAPPEADDDNPLEGLLRTQKMTKFLMSLKAHKTPWKTRPIVCLIWVSGLTLKGYCAPCQKTARR